ncbi:hypothetical protein ACS0TY_031864 [Phlomoides rotata]
MDISDNYGKEICPIPKKVKISDDKDLISDLPDDILVHILSFLPIKDAINTMLLRRFGGLWRSIQVLDFDSCLYHECEDPDFLQDYLNENFVDVIHYVLSHHDSTLDKLCLKFGFTLTYSRGEEYGEGFEYEKEWEKATVIQIDKLIRYSISRKVKVLDVNFKGCGPPMELWEIYDLPDVLTSNYLTHLKLAALNITSCTKIDMKSLRILLLNDVSLSDDIMESILLGCPSLEDLSLIDCYGLRELDCRNPNLKKVMLCLGHKEDKFLVVSCPYVLSLEIEGWLPRVFLMLGSPIVDVSIYYSYKFRCKQQQYHTVRCLLQTVSQCKTFSPCTWTILVFTIWNFMNVHCPSFDWKNLIMKVGLTKWHHPGLSLLLRNSLSLETLTIQIYPYGYSVLDFFFKTPEAKWIEAYEFDVDKYWDSQEATFPSLETISIYGYVNEPYVLQLVKFLLRSAARLQKLVISTKEPLKPTYERLQFTSEQLKELSQKFESLPRASPEVKLYFS